MLTHNSEIQKNKQKYICQKSMPYNQRFCDLLRHALICFALVDIQDV